ncbi:MAG: choline-sulfatase [Planctomycetota bacterium]
MPDAPRPKQVLWITTDHQRHDCIGANGNPAILTPHLDRLVQGGVSFDDCWVQNPVSMPSRASFMTGLYPTQTGVTWNGHELPHHHKTCAHLFGAGGYHTAQIGKLHFQCHLDHDLWLQPRHPYGFEYFVPSEEPGCYEDAYGTWLRSEHPQFREVMRVGRAGNPNRDAWVCTAVDAPSDVSHAGFCAEQTMRYLRMKPAEAPKFIHMGIYAPHPPLNPPKAILERYAGVEIPAPHAQAGEDTAMPPSMQRAMRRACAGRSPAELRNWRAHFYAMCTALDEQVGRVLAFLEERGELADTLIVFQSDHGDMAGDHGLMSKGHVTLYPEVMRVPLVFHWPRGIPGGKRAAGLVEAVDILPTMLDLAGAPVPAECSGRSFAQGLRTGNPAGTREDVLAQSGGEPGRLTCMLRTAGHHYLNYGPGQEVLFDLREDPRMYANRAADPACRGALAEMRERMLHRMLAAAEPAVKRVHAY